MARPRARLAALAAVLLCLPGAGAAQAETFVNGLSDQQMAKFDANHGQWTPQVHGYADLARSQVRYARYQVRWDVSLLPSSNSDVSDLRAWLDMAALRGYTPLITFMPSPAEHEPTRARFQNAMSWFRTNWPQVTEFTAWNEPNHPNYRVSASSAVDYYEALKAVCASCTVAAGDFSGNTSTPHTYWTDYKNEMADRGIDPAIWAYHPYEAINGSRTVTTAGVRAFIDIVGSHKRIWFTEVGAYFCKGDAYHGPASQNEGAARLQDLISSPAYAGVNANLDRVYYYHFSGFWRPGVACPQDSGLIDHVTVNGGAARPAFYTLFPQSPALLWELRLSNSSGPVDVAYHFGSSTATPVAGDWDGDGYDTVGTYADGAWSLRNRHSAGPAQSFFHFGAAGYIPLVGDWDGDGDDTIGVYEPAANAFHLRNSNSGGWLDVWVNYGFPGGVPIVGDWNGDGVDTVGMWNPANSYWYLRNSNTSGAHDIAFEFGWSGGRPVVGDWNGDGVDTIGMWDSLSGAWYMRNSNTFGGNDYGFHFGAPVHRPVSGDWDSTGNDTPGVAH